VAAPGLPGSAGVRLGLRLVAAARPAVRAAAASAVSAVAPVAMPSPCAVVVRCHHFFEALAAVVVAPVTLAAVAAPAVVLTAPAVVAAVNAAVAALATVVYAAPLVIGAAPAGAGVSSAGREAGRRGGVRGARVAVRRLRLVDPAVSAVVAPAGADRHPADHRARHERSRAHLRRQRSRARGGAHAAEVGHACAHRLGGHRPWDARKKPDRRRRGRDRPERVTRAMQELPHRAAAHAEGRRDLLIAPSFELAQDDRVTLVLGQLLHRGDHLREPLAALERLIRALHAVAALVERLLGERAVAQTVQGRVVGYPVEPWAQLELRVVPADRLVGVDE
jgi:hypothetical protein